MLRFDLLDVEALTSSESPSFAITPFAKRRSCPYLSKYEVARIVGERANQIVNGFLSLNIPMRTHNAEVNDVFTDHRSDAICVAEKCDNAYALDVDPIIIAKRELANREINMLVRRVWPNGSYEVIPINELHLDKALLDV